MRKLIAIILTIAVLLPVSALSVNCVSEVYTLFIDADSYNRSFNAGFDFDSMVFDFIIMSDKKTAYYSKQTWTNGIRTTTDVLECVLAYTDTGEKFIIKFPTGEVLDAYYDPEGNGIWIALGKNAYFRFLPVQHYDVSKDYRK